jgi:hypothetical protein
MRTIIAGSREATFKQVKEALLLCPWTPEISVVVSGTARGADQHGEAWAVLRGLGIERYAADWGKHGKAAGPIRNRQMAENAEALIAVWDGMSRGTKNMIDTAKSLGLRVFVHMIEIG